MCAVCKKGRSGKVSVACCRTCVSRVLTHFFLSFFRAIFRVLEAIGSPSRNKFFNAYFSCILIVLAIFIFRTFISAFGAFFLAFCGHIFVILKIGEKNKSSLSFRCTLAFLSVLLWCTNAFKRVFSLAFSLSYHLNLPRLSLSSSAEKYVPHAEHDALCTHVDALEVWIQQVFAAQSLPLGVGQQTAFNGPGQGQGFNPRYNNTPKAQNPTPGQGLWPMQMPPLAGSQGHGQGQLSFSGHRSGSSGGGKTSFPR